MLFLPASAQGIWTQKSNFGGAARQDAVGFSIGNKGYIGTGRNGINLYQDFWEWDQATDTWTQKANFPGVPRFYATGFSTGTQKGYLGTGRDSLGNCLQDFWEWDQVTNTWTQKTNFQGAARYGAVGFSIGTKGYIGTGQTPTGYANDFWEYDAVLDTWSQKSNFAGGARRWATGFSIGTKGYIGTGYNGNSKKDFWEWDQNTDTWSQLADLSGTARRNAVSFSVGNKGYISTGYNTPLLKDLWEYNPSAGTWVQKPDLGGVARWGAVGFSISDRCYIGTGWDGSAKQDFWEYCDTCSSTTSLSNNQSTEFSINVYPNPASDGNFILSFSSEETANYNLQIQNISGDIIYSKTLFPLSRRGAGLVPIEASGGEANHTNHPDSYRIDLSKHGTGIYFLQISGPSEQIKSGSGTAQKKIVIIK